MDRVRLPENSDLYLDDGVWKLRWRGGNPGPANESMTGEPISIGPAGGPGAISEKEAQRVVWKRFLSMLQENRSLEQSQMTIAEFVERKFVPEYVVTKNASGRTHYQAMLKHVLTPEEVDRVFHAGARASKNRLQTVADWPYLNDVRLCETQPDHVQQLTAAALKHGYSMQTVVHIRNVVSAIFSYAKREHCFVGDNPVRLVARGDVKRKVTSPLTFTQAKAVFDAMRYPEKEMMLLSVFTDINVSEMCGLQWKYVNLGGEAVVVQGERVPPKSIAVRQQWFRGDVEAVRQTQIRNLHIPRTLEQMLLRLRNRAEFTGPEDFVLVSRAGTPVNHANIRVRRLKPLAKQLGIDALSWHVLRSTCKAVASELGRQLEISLVPAPRVPNMSDLAQQDGLRNPAGMRTRN